MNRRRCFPVEPSKNTMPDIRHGTNLKGLPQNLPTLRKSFCLPLPDDLEYRALYLGAIYRLGNQSLYDRDPTHKAQQVAAIWREIYHDHSAILFADDGCNEEPCVDCCQSYIPEQDWVAFFPQDPFTTPEYIPAGYNYPPFYTNAALPFTSILPTDALLNILAFPVFQNLYELLQTGLPRCEIRFTGTGQIEVELIKLINGGWAWIQLDDRVDNDQVVNLNAIAVTEITDLQNFLDIAIEGSLSDTEIVEFEVDTVGDHKIVVYFLPDVGPDVLFGFGGGIRSIEMCGGLMPLEGYYHMQMQSISSGENCYMIQWRPNSTAAWIDLQEVCDGAAGADAPPLHMGFDAANCVLKYTQGDINSPYSGEGSEWISVFDWNLPDLKECLGITNTPILPPVTGYNADLCAIAWGISEYFITDLLEIYDRHLLLGNTYIGLGVIGDMLLEGGHWFGWNWLFGLSNVVNAWGDPTNGGRDTLDAYATRCYIAEAAFNSLSIVDDSVNFDKFAFETAVSLIDTHAAGINDAISRWAVELRNEFPLTKLHEYVSRGATFVTNETCIDFDCEPVDNPEIELTGDKGTLEYLGDNVYRITTEYNSAGVYYALGIARIGGGCFHIAAYSMDTNANVSSELCGGTVNNGRPSTYGTASLQLLNLRHNAVVTIDLTILVD